MIDYLTCIPFWKELTSEEQSLCEKASIITHYDSGSYLMTGCKNENCLGMIHVISGEIRAFVVSEEGREITLFRISDGENCVLSASCVLSHITFETHLNITRDAKILMIPSSTFGYLMESNIYVKCYTYELITERFSTVMWVMQQILFNKFDKRLADFFITEYEKTGKLEIHMTQEEIAIATNSAREVVARMIKQFVTDNLIEYKRGTIIIKDINAIKKLI